MADDSNAVIQIPQEVETHPTPSYPVIEGMNLIMTSFAAMQITLHSYQPGENLSMAYYLACFLLVLAFSVFLITKYLPEDQCSLALPLEQLGIFLTTTSLFFSFSMFLPPFIWVVLLFWTDYLLLVIIIIWCFYHRIAHQLNSSSSHQASSIGIHIV